MSPAAKKPPARPKRSAPTKPGKGPAQKAPATRAPRPSPAPLGSGGPLVVLVDGRALPDAEGEALWRAFSAHMDEHQGDTAGFAQARGYREVRPEYRRGQAVLVITS